MQQIVNINGYETIIEIPDSQVLSPVRVDGDENSYTIEYGNGLVEVGGIAMVRATRVKDGVIEGTKDIALDFYKTLDFQATAMNVVASPDILTGESCFVTKTNNGFKIYATASASQAFDIPVKWNAKGLR